MFVRDCTTFAEEAQVKHVDSTLKRDITLRKDIFGQC